MTASGTPVGVPARVGPLRAVSRAVRGALTWKGRASRSEFWWFLLVALLLVTAAGLAVSDWQSPPWPVLVTMLVLLPPVVTVTVRRLHDGGYSGWWFLIQYVPFIGVFWLLVLLVQPSQRLRNPYGPGPESPLVER